MNRDEALVVMKKQTSHQDSTVEDNDAHVECKQGDHEKFAKEKCGNLYKVVVDEVTGGKPGSGSTVTVTRNRNESK